jgi:DNA-directed RNA polymerase subunit omega
MRSTRVAGTVANPIGITNPPIDELLDRTDSKYSLVIYAAKRARQINAYYSQRRRGPARVRRPAGRDRRAGEAAVDRAAARSTTALLNHEHVADPVAE